MTYDMTRRHLFRLAALTGSGAILARGQKPVPSYDRPATVSLIHGEQRRKIVHDALAAIDEQIRPVLRRKKYVIIKPNIVSVKNQLASTHADALRGILDYLAPRFKGPVVIAESSAGETMDGYENFGYTKLPAEFRSQKVRLVDLNADARYELIHVLDANLHPAPVRLAAMLLDPEAYVICSAILKTHNTVVATLAIKNMTLGAPLHQAPKETPRWNDKRQYHGGVRQTHYGMYLTALKMQPFFGATLIDGYEGMEGNGPVSGTPVPSRVAIASTDYVAADRIGVEAMGINADWLGYLKFCHTAGLGQYDLGKIDIRGAKLADIRKTYVQHKDMERQLQWMGEMTDLPPKLG